MNKVENENVNHYFHSVPKTRLIVSVEPSIITEINNLVGHDRSHPANKNWSEFARLAVVEKLKDIIYETIKFIFSNKYFSCWVW